MIIKQEAKSRFLALGLKALKRCPVRLIHEDQRSENTVLDSTSVRYGDITLITEQGTEIIVDASLVRLIVQSSRE